MKYCVKCGNPMDDAMQFCQKCGAKCVIPTDEANYPPQQDNYAEYWGLHYKDTESGSEIELTPDGVRIFHSKGMKQFRFDKTIPYTEIIDVNSVRATALKSGYLSIITATEGITGKATRQQLIFDHNTVLFTKKTEPEAERIYRAIEDICSAPPASTIHTTYYESSTGKQEVVSSPSLKNPVKPRKKTGCLIPILAVFVIATIAAIIGSNSGNGNHSEDPKPEASTSVIIDVEKYGNISGNELISLVGEPDEISQGTCQGAFDIPCVYYEYGNASILGEVSFVLVNDQVVRFTSYRNYPYENKDEVLTQFGINKESSCAVAADTNIALRYRCPSAKVDDFWINLIDGDTFGFLQITYDMEYFEEWYLPLTSDEEIKYKSDAELTMKSLLTSPKTADFPWYDWEYGKNLFYILVSSYVDAENAFGVEMRNTFTFVYSRLTGEIVLAIVNDEVVVDNGYVAVEDLIAELYTEMSKAASSVQDDSATPKVSETSSAVNSTTEAPPSGNQPIGKSEETTQSQSNNQFPSFTGSTCLDINYNGDGMPASNVTNFSGSDMICVAGRFSGIVGENNVKIIWTCPDGYVFTDQQYCYENGDTLQCWKSAEDIGSGSASVSIVLDTTGETLATYYFNVTGAPTYTNDASNDMADSYDDPYGEMDDVNAGLAYQDYLENLPSLDSIDWETETESSDLDGICTSLTDEELAALQAASGN